MPLTRMNSDLETDKLAITRMALKTFRDCIVDYDDHSATATKRIHPYFQAFPPAHYGEAIIATLIIVTSYSTFNVIVN